MDDNDSRDPPDSRPAVLELALLLLRSPDPCCAAGCDRPATLHVRWALDADSWTLCCGEHLLEAAGPRPWWIARKLRPGRWDW